jgi:hypothetical protein
MRTFKTEILSHRNMLPMFVGIEYDSKTDLTITICKIVGKTIVYKNPNKDWDKTEKGNQEQLLVNRFKNDKGFRPCSIDEFDKYKIGEKPPK